MKVNAETCVMIDIKKLEEKFDVLFAKEDQYSFSCWLAESRKNEILQLLGKGYISHFKPVKLEVQQTRLNDEFVNLEAILDLIPNQYKYAA